MITSLIEEPIVTHEYYKEFFSKITKYKDCVRKSLFVRYLNINKTASIVHKETEGTFDKFTTNGISYDTYDYTPAFSITPLLNNTQSRQDLTGYKYDGNMTIVIYTIDHPTINDLIVFPYDPGKSEEIFRVTAINTVLNASNYEVKYHELTLEYAPIKNVTNLSYINHFVYLNTQEKNILQQDYVNIIKQLNDIKITFGLIKGMFNEKFELYTIIYDRFVIAPFDLNALIYNYIAKEKENRKYLSNYNIPFGIHNYEGLGTNLGLDVIDNQVIYTHEDGTPKLVFDIDTNQYEFTDDPSIFDIIDVTTITTDLNLLTLNGLITSFKG